MKLPKSRRIRSVVVKNPTILPEEITKKFIILDILATDDMTLHIFELPKFGKLMKSGQMSDAMSEWLRFLSHAHQEDETMRMTYKNPAIHKAFGILESLSADEESRYLAEMREKALKTERTDLNAAERRGIQKGWTENAIRTAENLLKMGILTTEQISQATGLGKKEILKIRKSLDKQLLS